VLAQFPANFNPADSRQSNVEKYRVIGFVDPELEALFTRISDVYGVRILS
jgi:hypothetical protein